jgi:hypothetical protein
MRRRARLRMRMVAYFVVGGISVVDTLLSRKYLGRMTGWAELPGWLHGIVFASFPLFAVFFLWRGFYARSLLWASDSN